MIFLGKELGEHRLPFIVAEISCNHEGNLEQAKALIEAAKIAGADAVKFQTYYAEDMTIDHESDDFIIKDGIWGGNTLYNLYRKTQTPYEYLEPLFEFAKKMDIPMFSSVFSQKGLSVLEDLGCPAYKIASFELVDLPLIRKVAKTAKPVVLSTGMASLEEIDEAMICCLAKNTIILHCVSAYPTMLEQANLWRIPDLINYYPQSIVGFSDHTFGVTVGPLACVAGARVIEKHLALPGSESADEVFSIHPREFKTYVELCREATSATFKVHVKEEQTNRQFRRSIYAVKDIAEGESFTQANIRSIRPSYGLPPKTYSRLIAGMRATKEIKAGTALTKEMII